MLRTVPAVLLFAAGCGPDAGVEPCRPGFSRAADGRCWPPAPDPEPASATDAIEALAPCVSIADPDGSVDLDGGCVDDACAGATFAQIDAALEGDAGCATASWSEEWVYCTWPAQVEGLFPDFDRDGVGDPDGRTDWIHLRPGFAGATPEGVGVGVSPRCWVDLLGVPGAATWVDVSGALALQDLYWPDYGVDVHDWDGAPDGAVDDVYLFGAR